ncbi:MAG: 50S ribosomal protein L4 [Sedimentisphaerales bacterium]|nr:50S ribosomal protein L4 [Sedimentisphaerales bacterium]
MIDIPVYDKQGKEVDRIQIDEAVLGLRVRLPLLKQAIVMYHANKRQGTVGTKSRGMVAGSTTKLYRQKGTGRARVGSARTVVRTGGGVAFAKRNRDFSKDMPKKQRRLARDSAILAKLKSDDAVVINEFKFDTPKTKDFAAILRNLKIDRSCLVALGGNDENVYKSLRNIPNVDALTVAQLNAGDICRRRKIVFTREALDAVLASASGAPKNA